MTGDQLLVAASLGLALYSYNTADYCILHRQWLAEARSHAGIIVAQQQRYPVGEVGWSIDHWDPEHGPSGDGFAPLV